MESILKWVDPVTHPIVSICLKMKCQVQKLYVKPIITVCQTYIEAKGIIYRY